MIFLVQDIGPEQDSLHSPRAAIGVMIAHWGLAGVRQFEAALSCLEGSLSRTLTYNKYSISQRNRIPGLHVNVVFNKDVFVT